MLVDLVCPACGCLQMHSMRVVIGRGDVDWFDRSAIHVSDGPTLTESPWHSDHLEDARPNELQIYQLFRGECGHFILLKSRYHAGCYQIELDEIKDAKVLGDFL